MPPKDSVWRAVDVEQPVRPRLATHGVPDLANIRRYAHAFPAFCGDGENFKTIGRQPAGKAPCQRDPHAAPSARTLRRESQPGLSLRPPTARPGLQ